LWKISAFGSVDTGNKRIVHHKYTRFVENSFSCQWPFVRDAGNSVTVNDLLHYAGCFVPGINETKSSELMISGFRIASRAFSTYMQNTTFTAIIP
jgi:hypothetical protein